MNKYPYSLYLESVKGKTILPESIPGRRNTDLHCANAAHGVLPWVRPRKHRVQIVGGNRKSIGSTVSDTIVRGCLWSIELGVANWATSVAWLPVVDNWLHK